MAFLTAIDIGPMRTLQQVIEFGIVQIVDIALKAISPAVNDPTTAISCVDQLSSLVIRWLGRAPPVSGLYNPPYVLRLIVPWIGIEGLLDLAFEQIRHHAEMDLAVSLRLMRAFCDIVSVVDDPDIGRIFQDRGNRVGAGFNGKVHDADLERLRGRLQLLEMRAAQA